jgi:hypothetical protein
MNNESSTPRYLKGFMYSFFESLFCEMQGKKIGIFSSFLQVLFTASSPSVSNKQFKLTRCATQSFMHALQRRIKARSAQQAA